MNYKKFIRKNALFLSALLVVTCVVTVLVIVNRPKVEFKESVAEIGNLVANDSNLVSPQVIMNEGKDGSPTFLLIDIRNTEQFGIDHISNAVNMPAFSLFTDESLAFLKEALETEKDVVLYGSDHLQANGPWLLLRQVGFDNIKVMKGGFEAYKQLATNDTLLHKSLLIKTEVSVFDTAAFRKPAAEKAVAAEKPAVKKAVKVVPVKQEESSGGGC